MCATIVVLAVRGGDVEVAAALAARRPGGSILIERAEDMPELVGGDRGHLIRAVEPDIGGDDHKGAADIGISEVIVGEAPVFVGGAVDNKNRRRPIGMARAALGLVRGVGL